jgi:hypothetical protein
VFDVVVTPPTPPPPSSKTVDTLLLQARTKSENEPIARKEKPSRRMRETSVEGSLEGRTL